jgi:hypothetical protein
MYPVVAHAHAIMPHCPKWPERPERPAAHGGPSGPLLIAARYPTIPYLYHYKYTILGCRVSLCLLTHTPTPCIHTCMYRYTYVRFGARIPCMCMEARRKGEKGRAVRGKDGVGDAGATGITPHGRGEQQQWQWHQGNRETTRGGRTRDQRGHWGEDTKNQLKTIEEHEGGRTMRDGECRPLSEGAREENPTRTHTPPRRVSVESGHAT